MVYWVEMLQKSLTLLHHTYPPFVQPFEILAALRSRKADLAARIFLTINIPGYTVRCLCFSWLWISQLSMVQSILSPLEIDAGQVCTLSDFADHAYAPRLMTFQLNLRKWDSHAFQEASTVSHPQRRSRNGSLSIRRQSLLKSIVRCGRVVRCGVGARSVIETITGQWSDNGGRVVVDEMIIWNIDCYDAK